MGENTVTSLAGKSKDCKFYGASFLCGSVMCDSHSDVSDVLDSYCGVLLVCMADVPCAGAHVLL